MSNPYLTNLRGGVLKPVVVHGCGSERERSCFPCVHASGSKPHWTQATYPTKGFDSRKLTPRKSFRSLRRRRTRLLTPLLQRTNAANWSTGSFFRMNTHRMKVHVPFSSVGWGRERFGSHLWPFFCLVVFPTTGGSGRSRSPRSVLTFRAEGRRFPLQDRQGRRGETARLES